MHLRRRIKKHISILPLFLQVSIKFYLNVKNFLTLNKNKLQKFQKKDLIQQFF